MSFASHTGRGLTISPRAAVRLALTPGAVGDALRIVVRENGATTELVVSGEWDLAQPQAASEAIRAALGRCPDWVVLDLSQLSFIDLHGIYSVLEIRNQCAKQDIHLVIIPGSRALQRPFEICGLIDRLPFLEVPR
jgi:anti-anti-sigma factor